MKQQFQAQMLTIYVGENDQFRGGPLYAALVSHLREAGIGGVTVLHGIEGYGASGKVHTERIEVLFEGLPLVVQAVDTPERIAAALSLLDGMLTGGLVTVHDVQAIRFSKDSRS